MPNYASSLGRPRWSDPGDPLQTLPKVSLHDHLDGSLRPETMLELADEQGIKLPHADPDTLAGWFQGTVAEPVVNNWDDKFGITTRLMQDPDSIARVAREFVLDLAGDGVIYGETRWAPEKHTLEKLTLDETVHAVTAGLADGQQRAAAAGHQIRVTQILCGMRTSARSEEIAELTTRHYGADVVGFDLAGEELGYPATNHLAAIDRLHEASIPVTLHAGEHDGITSLAPTVYRCHPVRLGHGVRIVEDLELAGHRLGVRTAARQADAAASDTVTLGPLARWIRDRRIPLEICLSSNSKGNVVNGRHNHPVDLLKALEFTVTLNPDNRMMSATCVTREMRYAVAEFGWATADLWQVTRNAAEAAFLPLPSRAELLATIDTGWATA